MKNIKKTHTKVLCTLMLFFISTSLFAQTGFDKTYSFSPVPNYSVYSGINTILADTQSIFIMGGTLKEASSAGQLTNSNTFLASVDYSGNIQWSKRLSFPPPFQSNYPQFIRLLAKVNNNKYVLGAQGFEHLSPDYYRQRPFLYFFDANGDSIKFIPIPFGNINDINYFRTLMTDKQKNTIVSGAFRNSAQDTSGIWLAKFNTSGDFLWRKVVLDTPFYYGGSDAQKIIQGIGDNSYIIGGLARPADSAYKSFFTIWKTDTAGNVLWRKSLPKTPNWAGNEFYGGNVWFDIIKANNNS